MTKEITYSGYSANPSDYECADGQLAASLNLIHEDGHLRPIFQPESLCELGDGYKVVYIHKTSSFTHYILQSSSERENVLAWVDEEVMGGSSVRPVPWSTVSGSMHELHSFYKDVYDPQSVRPRRVALEIYSINSVGNTLLVLAEDGMHYLLWKSDTDGYRYLGTHLPELPLSFGLQAEKVNSEVFYQMDIDALTYSGDILESEGTAPEGINFNNPPPGVNISEPDAKNFSDRLLGFVNKFIADKSTNAGKFMFPFFVRYAYRLYDGTLTMHSSPVLMITSSFCSPSAVIEGWDTIERGGESIIRYANTRLKALVFDMDYRCLNAGALTAINDWSDIITSVDVFVSAPIYTYKQSGEVEGWSKYFGTDGYSVSKMTGEGHFLYKKYSVCSELNPMSGGMLGSHEFILPTYTEDDIKENIRDCSTFYRLRQLKMSEITTSRTKIEMSQDYLASLTSREVMTDDYDSHDTLIPRFSYNYNSRINLSGLSKRLAPTGSPLVYISYREGYLSDMERYKLHVYIKQDGRDIVIDYSASDNIDSMSKHPFIYLYHPNPNAYKVIVEHIPEGSSEPMYWSFPLEPHNFLNGAFFFAGFSPAYTILSSLDQASDNRIVALPNKVYTSEVNNPFLFSATGINSIGTGEIVGLCSATKALSQGQFGQFPMYVFSTDGVYAMSVSGTGSFNTAHPVTRDVCINSGGITQIDTAVLFQADRGIILLQGSDTVCLTDIIASEHPFDVLVLPKASALHDMLGNSEDRCFPTKPFHAFLSDCRMVYDYKHQRIVVFNPAVDDNGTPLYTYAYVYSLKSKLWGMMHSTLRGTVNSYPDALAMTHAGELVSFGSTAEEEAGGLFITRPMKLEAPDMYKSVHAVLQRGQFRRGDVKTVLWGSNDLYSWHLVGTSVDHTLRGLRGTPYKYFRIGAFTSLTDDKSVYGASVDTEIRHTNQLK